MKLTATVFMIVLTFTFSSAMAWNNNNYGSYGNPLPPYGDDNAIRTPSATYGSGGMYLHTPSATYGPDGVYLHTPGATYAPDGIYLHTPSATFGPNGELFFND